MTTQTSLKVYFSGSNPCKAAPVTARAESGGAAEQRGCPAVPWDGAAQRGGHEGLGGEQRRGSGASEQAGCSAAGEAAGVPPPPPPEPEAEPAEHSSMPSPPGRAAKLRQSTAREWLKRERAGQRDARSRPPETAGPAPACPPPGGAGGTSLAGAPGSCHAGGGAPLTGPGNPTFGKRRLGQSVALPWGSARGSLKGQAGVAEPSTLPSAKCLRQLHLDLGQVTAAARFLCGPPHGGERKIAENFSQCWLTSFTDAAVSLCARQADFSLTRCHACGMHYAKGELKDEKIHAEYHRRTLRGVSFKVPPFLPFPHSRPPSWVNPSAPPCSSLPAPRPLTPAPCRQGHKDGRVVFRDAEGYIVMVLPRDPLKQRRTVRTQPAHGRQCRP